MRRFLWTVTVAFLVLSGTFILVAAPPDPNGMLVAWTAAIGGGNASAALESYQAGHGLDQTLLARYINFMTGLLTLKWGHSTVWGEPVSLLIAERGLVTATYVVPSLLFSAVAGTLVGVFVSMRESTRLDSLTSGLAYVGFGIPNFWLALILATILSSSFFIESRYDLERSFLALDNLTALLVPAFAVSTTLFAVQLRYVRAETRAHLQADVVKTVRAKGTSHWRVARHAFRRAALPLLSIVSEQVLTVLFISVFAIEAALGVPGLGDLAFTAIQRRDVPVVMICALIPIMLGVIGHFFQDVFSMALDPRIGADGGEIS